MNLDKVNQWLMLTANLGVLVGIFAVVLELRQTQTAMSAEASTMRAQMAIQNSNARIDNGIRQINLKIEANEILTDEENERARNFLTTQLRYFENIHYQYSIGVLDEEIWLANYAFLSDMCNTTLFGHIYPDWFNSRASAIYRTSFVEVIRSGCRD